MSPKDQVTTVDESGRDRADWDRIEQVLLQQPPAASPTSARPAQREESETPEDTEVGGAVPSDPPAGRPGGPAITTADVASAGERPVGSERTPASTADAAGVDTATSTKPTATTANRAAGTAATMPTERDPSVETRSTPTKSGSMSDETSTAEASTTESSAALFASDQSEDFRSRWNTVQAAFVDDPRESVHEADGLVAEVMQQLASTFAAERTNLEAQWSRGDDVSTEDLRQALRRYRSFFDRLLSF
jgi:hypothetical protein